MRRLLVALTLVTLMAWSPARSQDAAAAIRGVISDQIAAFRADDFETAFGFASPAIRRMFGAPDRFGEMVRRGYPMVWRPADVRFSGLAEQGGRTVQSVLITDQSGALFVVDYEMVAYDGRWVINGVWVRRANGVGA
jgi:hypothetical protein